MAINDFLQKGISSVLEDPLNTGANLYSAKLSKQALTLSQKTYDLQLKLYDEFETTHNDEEQRYKDGLVTQQLQMDLLKQILEELKKLNGNK